VEGPKGRTSKGGKARKGRSFDTIEAGSIFAEQRAKKKKRELGLPPLGLQKRNRRRGLTGRGKKTVTPSTTWEKPETGFLRGNRRSKRR